MRIASMRFEWGSGAAGTTGAGAGRSIDGIDGGGTIPASGIDAGGTVPASWTGGGGGGGGCPPPEQNTHKQLVTD